MFSITTTILNTNGTKVLAKGHGKQRTLPYDHSMNHDGNLGAAVGALLNVLTDDRQQAKVKHPSGGQRVRVEHLGYQKNRWTIDV